MNTITYLIIGLLVALLILGTVVVIRWLRWARMVASKYLGEGGGEEEWR